MRHVLLAMMFGAALAFGAAACGDDDDDGPAAATGTTAASNATTASGTTAAATTASGDDLLAAYAAMEIPEGLANGDTLGSPDAPVTVMLFEDFQCPFCLAFNLQFERIFVEEYAAEGKILLQFRHYTILGAESIAAARASFCVADQDVFWPFHNRLFLEQARAGQLSDEQLNVGRFSDANLRTYAEEAGADVGVFDTCYADPATLARVQADVTEARNLGLRGTPSMLVDGVAVSTPRTADALRALLDEAVAEAAP